MSEEQKPQDIEQEVEQTGTPLTEEELDEASGGLKPLLGKNSPILASNIRPGSLINGSGAGIVTNQGANIITNTGANFK